MKKRIICFLLTIVMLFGLLPGMAFATEEEATEENGQAEVVSPDSFDADEGTLFIGEKQYWLDNGAIICDGEVAFTELNDVQRIALIDGCLYAIVGAEETWTEVLHIGDLTLFSNGYYSLTHAASGMSMDVMDGLSANGTNVAVHSGNGTFAQQWAIRKNGDGYVLISRCSGYALDVYASEKKNGTNIEQHPYHGGANQTWYFVPAEYTISYNANDGTDVPANQTKYYKEALVISSATPSRDGYSFLGWSEDKTAATAQYQSGSSFTKDANATLYAVWQKDTPPVNSDARFVISSETGRSGQEVTVSVSVEQNPGIVTAYLNIFYDADKLQLTAVTDTGLLLDSSFSSI